MNDQDSRIRQALAEVVKKYPADQQPAQASDIPRQAMHIGLVMDAKGSGARVCDIGGGTGLFSVGCAALGMKATLVDDFRDPGNLQQGVANVLDVHRSYGVEVVSCDVIEEGIDFAPGSFDMVTSFDSMEHWHHSPKKLFAQVMQTLAPGGMFLLCCPNCVNLRKRIATPLGRNKWSRMADWYEQPRFRGHVREPDLDDLRYIARDMSLVDCRVLGRNWLGHVGPGGLRGALVRFIDRPLQLFPSLCSDIYIMGHKPG
jgi:2-polyprenyl-3-methyl-5-hydroxy-6-metoxy-1,4-benzoquinol methylase